MKKIKKYFVTRRQWGVEIEDSLRRQALKLENYWSRVFEQRIQKEKNSVATEKDFEIKIIENELKEKKDENKYLKKQELEIEKLKNELRAKIQHIDYQNKLLEEVHSRISIQLGMNDSIIRNSEKLLKKEVEE